MDKPSETGVFLTSSDSLSQEVLKIRENIVALTTVLSDGGVSISQLREIGIKSVKDASDFMLAVAPTPVRKSISELSFHQYHKRDFRNGVRVPEETAIDHVFDKPTRNAPDGKTALPHNSRLANVSNTSKANIPERLQTLNSGLHKSKNSPNLESTASSFPIRADQLKVFSASNDLSPEATNQLATPSIYDSLSTRDLTSAMRLTARPPGLNVLGIAKEATSTATQTSIPTVTSLAPDVPSREALHSMRGDNSEWPITSPEKSCSWPQSPVKMMENDADVGALKSDNSATQAAIPRPNFPAGTSPEQFSRDVATGGLKAATLNRNYFSPVNNPRSGESVGRIRGQGEGMPFEDSHSLQSLPSEGGQPRGNQEAKLATLQTANGQHIQGDVLLDGVSMGRWVVRLLSRHAGRANVGPTGFDSRRGRLLPGPTVGNG